MAIKMEVDYDKIGLKVGLEIHQQLDSHKLFCECPSIIREDEPDFEVHRKLKAIAGELGQKDIAAVAEELKNKTFVYQGYKDTTCLVELDEEPPHPINMDAVKTALQVALMLHMKPIDEIEVMRKTVIDGSNTTGFQRTALVARNGYVETSGGKVRIPTLAIEEDAARKIKEEGNKIYWRLDRLGIPLIEIMTSPDIRSPEQAKETAQTLGLILRMTGKVRRGIGTIRQDINISIEGGSRVEIKGVQNLADIPSIIKLEIERQKNLIEISKKLKLRNAQIEKKFVDVAKIFCQTESKLIKKNLEEGKCVFGMKLRGFATLLKKPIQGERYLAKEIVDYLKALTNMKGFIHSDELPNYGISEKEIVQLRNLLECKPEDGFAFVFGTKEECERGLSVIADRCAQLINGVPSEVRDVNEDLTTRFIRPMPGAARMYPETDELPVEITKELINSIKIPESPEKRLNKFKSWGLSDQLANQMLWSESINIFESLVEKFKNIMPTIIATHLLSAEDEIRKRYKIDVSSLKAEHFEDAFSLLDKGKIAKEGVIEILAYLARKPEITAEQAMKELKLEKISIRELNEIINKVLQENAELSAKKDFQILMGFVMRKVRGRIDGEIVAKELKKALGL